MLGLTYALIFIFLFIGLLYPCLALFGHDVYFNKSKTLTTIIRWRRRDVDIWQLQSLNNILQIVAPLIPISENTEQKMNERLARADLPYTAKEYYAKAIMSGLVGFLVAITGASMNSYFIVIVGLLLALLFFFKNIDQVDDILKEKYVQIEASIPTMIRSIVSGLQTDRNIINVFYNYKKIAPTAMKSELELLLADMKSSSIPKALSIQNGFGHKAEIACRYFTVFKRDDVRNRRNAVFHRRIRFFVHVHFHEFRFIRILFR